MENAGDKMRFIEDPKARNETFLKLKAEILKEYSELSAFCGAEFAVFFYHREKLTPMATLLSRPLLTAWLEAILAMESDHTPLILIFSNHTPKTLLWLLTFGEVPLIRVMECIALVWKSSVGTKIMVA
ncbi:uncharacterized protein G2W53_015471 [Senna tora]|uniref:MADS-box domain-containing protein n=1 Tax=Senna tora TaxID=362788 RepID=A0A834WV21_9FABA|nr:uncharacterized protein G2W53_015471 [Senna tora]